MSCSYCICKMFLNFRTSECTEHYHFFWHFIYLCLIKNSKTLFLIKIFCFAQDLVLIVKIKFFLSWFFPQTQTLKFYILLISKRILLKYSGLWDIIKLTLITIKKMLKNLLPVDKVSGRWKISTCEFECQKHCTCSCTHYIFVL